MRILVTGHRGHVGAPLARQLGRAGFDVTGFDRADGQDVLDLSQLKRAAAGCAAVVHLAALAHDSAGTPQQIMAVNAHVTHAALQGVCRTRHRLARQQFASLSPVGQAKLTGFMNAAILVDPMEYQRHVGEASDPPAPLRTLHFGPTSRRPGHLSGLSPG
jgi:nucleoside-diphosphate-sugar epimerase